MQTNLWTWNNTCVISPWESTEIKTKSISRSVFNSQILQNVEMNIVVHWKFWRKYGSVSHLFSCINNCKWIQNDFHLIVCGSSSGTLFLKTYYVLQVLFMVNLACCSFLVCFFLHHIAWKKERKTLLCKLQNIPKNVDILVNISISVIDVF